jgi:hypothetical protein
MFNCNSCTASFMFGGNISTTLNRSLHIPVYQEYIETRLIGVALETRKGRLCDCERNIVLWLFTAVSLSCFCLWAWEVDTQYVTEVKYDRMRFWSQESTHFGLWDSWLSVLVVRYSIEPPSIPALPPLAPVSNVAVRVENSDGAAEEWRETTLLHLQTAKHQDT